MVRGVIEKIEELRAANSVQRDEPHYGLARALLVEKALVDCLQELRAIVAKQARDLNDQRPSLRIV
jgi:hypothetical protein